MMKQWMKWFAVGAVAAFAAFAAGASAQGYPSKQVRIIVPQAPGGASDALSRIIGAKLGEKWGQQVIVENRAGTRDPASIPPPRACLALTPATRSGVGALFEAKYVVSA